MKRGVCMRACAYACVCVCVRVRMRACAGTDAFRREQALASPVRRAFGGVGEAFGLFEGGHDVAWEEGGERCRDCARIAVEHAAPAHAALRKRLLDEVFEGRVSAWGARGRVEAYDVKVARTCIRARRHTYSHTFVIAHDDQ